MKVNFMKDVLNQVLFLIAIFIGFIILSTTIIIFFNKKNNYIESNKNFEIPLQKNNELKYSSYTELGRLRVVTLSDPKIQENGIVAIVSPWFSYEDDDKTFYEELSRKKNLLKEIVLNYFSKYTKAQLKSKGEENIKQELCIEINKNLSLNKIKAVYFSEYIFLD